jgi:hypothetical protein
VARQKVGSANPLQTTVAVVVLEVELVVDVTDELLTDDVELVVVDDRLVVELLLVLDDEMVDELLELLTELVLVLDVRLLDVDDDVVELVTLERVIVVDVELEEVIEIVVVDLVDSVLDVVDSVLLVDVDVVVLVVHVPHIAGHVSRTNSPRTESVHKLSPREDRHWEGSATPLQDVLERRLRPRSSTLVAISGSRHGGRDELLPLSPFLHTPVDVFHIHCPRRS